ncbi:hypothetical protein TNCV_3073341 [Trichonephila clavipes]|nr:hypothetical protein TNCV_3073341 [Trichonephila clavipes]
MIDFFSSETFLRSRVNEKNCPVLRNSEQVNGSSLPPSPRIIAMVRRERGGGKGGAGTPRDLRHIGGKVGSTGSPSD